MTKIKVCVADDHTLFRKLMKEQISRFERCDPFVLEAENGKRLLQVLSGKTCDVVLLDINMPVLNGYEAAKHILIRYPKTKVIVLTMNDSQGPVLQFMEMGVHGYLLKTCEPQEVEKAIYDVVDLDFYNNQLTIKALRLIASGKKAHTYESLTEREIEIVRLICNEMTMAEMAEELSISLRTVENHRSSILKKLQAQNTVGIVKYAYETGLISSF